MISSLKFASLHISSFFFTQSSLLTLSESCSLLSFSLKIASATHSSFQHTQQLSIIGNLSQWSTMNKLSAIESESGKAHAQAHRLLHIVVIVSLLSQFESSNIWNRSGLLLGCVSTLLVRTRNVHRIVKSSAEEGPTTGRMRKRTKEETTTAHNWIYKFFGCWSSLFFASHTIPSNQFIHDNPDTHWKD